MQLQVEDGPAAPGASPSMTVTSPFSRPGRTVKSPNLGMEEAAWR